jgi:hypothetical protein
MVKDIIIPEQVEISGIKINKDLSKGHILLMVRILWPNYGNYAVRSWELALLIVKKSLVYGHHTAGLTFIIARA